MNLESAWITGFVDGEGCFYIGINNHPKMSAQYQVLPEFVVVQHERDIQILYALKSFFGCGRVVNNHGDRKAFRVRKREHLTQVIVPFFEKHELKTKKRLDFICFRKVLQMMQRDEHLEIAGLERIRRIKARMNRGRIR